MRPDFSSAVSGPAYGRGFRILATAIFVAVIAAGVRAYLGLPDDPGAKRDWSLLAVAAIALAGSYYLLMSATTTIDAKGIRQSGLMERKVEWEQIEAARLGGFSFSRRLIVRAGFGRAKVFFGGSPELVAAFEKIAAAYPRR